MSALHWEAMRKQKVVNKKAEQKQKQEEELKKLQEQNRQEIQEAYNKGRHFGASSKMSSYEHQLESHASSRASSRSYSSQGDGVCSRGVNHSSMDTERRREYHESVKRIPMKIRYDDTDFAQQW